MWPSFYCQYGQGGGEEHKNKIPGIFSLLTFLSLSLSLREKYVSRNSFRVSKQTCPSNQYPIIQIQQTTLIKHIFSPSSKWRWFSFNSLFTHENFLTPPDIWNSNCAGIIKKVKNRKKGKLKSLTNNSPFSPSSFIPL